MTFRAKAQSAAAFLKAFFAPLRAFAPIVKYIFCPLTYTL